MYDLIIIGAGTAGFSAYKHAVKHTQNLLIINSGTWDTTCARVGCMPSKVLISAANRAYDAQHLQDVGLSANVNINTDKIMQHVRSLRDRFTASTLKQVDAWPEQHKISGQAQFVNANTVRVNGQQYQAKAFVIAVGSSPVVDPVWKAELGHRLITSDELFELPELPQSMAVIGSGVIALELAQAFSRLGVKTEMFARSQRIGALSSTQLQQQAQQIFAQQLPIYWKTVPSSLCLKQDQAQLDFAHEGKQKQQHYDYVLQATGRKSNLSNLNLQHIHAAFADLKQLKIDEHSAQLADYPIYIVGDAHSTRAVQHEAAFAGKQAAHNALLHSIDKNVSTSKKRTVHYNTPLSIVFSEPQMASIGLSSTALEKCGQSFVVGQVDYRNQGRALVLGKAQGAAEVYVDAQTHQLLGAELLCHDAEHLAHLLAWMIEQKLKVSELLAQPFYHPTLQEGLRTALQHAQKQLNVSN